MLDNDSTTSKRRRLSSALRAMRADAGISTVALAERLGWSQSKVSKIENGRTRPSTEDVTAWCHAFKVKPAAARQLVDLAAQAYVEARGWRTSRQARYRKLNERASRVAMYMSQVVPGLFQTAEYTRRVFALYGIPERDQAAAVAARVDRQSVLYDDSKQFDAIITEAALRWQPGPRRVLLAQLDRILSVMTLDNVRVGVVPHGTEALTLPTNAFTLREFPDAEPLVTIETHTGEIAITDPDGIVTYTEVWARHEREAVHGNQAVAFIRTLMTELTNGGPVDHAREHRAS